MRVIPVLDIRSGGVVHAVAGRRHEYRPLQTRLTHSTDPIDVAQALRSYLNCSELYVADLDAICHGHRQTRLYGDLASLGCDLWLDAGVRSADDVDKLVNVPVAKVILGLETLAGPELVAELAGQVDPSRLVFSLDLRNGQPICSKTWQQSDPLEILSIVIGSGIGTVILLDLARVGTGGGLGTEALCAEVRRRWPNLKVVLGGGIGSPDDLRRAAACGAEAVLVASALHDGRLTRNDLEALLSRS
jgi:phosphoribosylformimino-5-aminoimidazole carboxamide ribotide isomerase